MTISVRISIDTDSASWAEECTRIVDAQSIAMAMQEELESFAAWSEPREHVTIRRDVRDTNGNTFARIEVTE